jgi:metal-responsive CopG/Arc/MetJ family transcriptional regulator
MKKHNEDDLLTIRIAKPLMDKFKNKCNSEYKNMSEAIRELIREYIKGE